MRAYISHYIAGRTEQEIKNVEAIGTLYAIEALGLDSHQIVLPRQITPWCLQSGDHDHLDDAVICQVPGRSIPGDDHTVPCYLRADFAELLRCDVVVMTPGWETSSGALAELQLAVHAGIRVEFA